MVYIFLADGFEEIEAITPIDILRRSGVDIVTVGVTGKTVNGAHGIPFVCDITINETKEDGIDAVILPGGMPGTKNLENNDAVINLVKNAVRDNRLVCAICAAPSILGHLNILNGKAATCYPGFEKELSGAKIINNAAVSDGNIITACGPGAAKEFSFAILSALMGEKISKETENSMCYR